MAFKIKHIATRFFLQSIYTVLIIATLYLIVFYSGHRKKDIEKAISKVEEINTLILISSQNIDNAYNSLIVDQTFVQEGCDELIARQESITENIYGLFDSVNALKFIGAYMDKASLDDSVKMSLENYSLAFSKLLYSLKEKGNRTGGLVQSALKQMDAVAIELKIAPDNGVQAAVFNDLKLNYLTGLSLHSLTQLINFCEDVVAPFYYVEGYDVSLLESEVMKLSQLLSRIQEIDLRLNNETMTKGQLVDLRAYLAQLKERFNRYHNKIDQQTIRYSRFWNIAIAGWAFLIILSYTLIMGRFSRTVVSAVRKLHDITISLAQGNIKDTIPEGGSYEFYEFNKDFKRLFGMLNSRKDFINDLLKDNFETELKLSGEGDEIGQALKDLQGKMLEAQQTQDKYNTENIQRRYTNEGLAKFAEIMRVNSNDTTILADIFIKELVKYLEIEQGALYLSKSDDQNVLELASVFAYDRKRYINKKINSGEGLIGTCAMEKKTINLTNVPDNYIIIRSGLGDTPPNNVIVIPVMDAEELVGVIELAALKIFREIEIGLIENIAESLASTIITARNNSRTNELLKKSQIQAAEMAEQEEEMRQNMEELKATQEESARREDEMQGLLDAISKTFYLLEYDLTGSITHANDKVLGFVEQSYEQVLHRTHQEIIAETSQISIDFIQDVISNKQPANLIEQNSWGSEEYNYQYFISPVLSSNGEVIKVINLFNIEEV